MGAPAALAFSRLPKGRRHELGLQHGPRFPRAAGLDARLRAARDLAARGDLARPWAAGAARGDRAAAGAGQGARVVGSAPAAGARRPGHGPGAPGPHARDPRTSPIAPLAFG